MSKSTKHSDIAVLDLVAAIKDAHAELASLIGDRKWNCSANDWPLNEPSHRQSVQDAFQAICDAKELLTGRRF